MSYYFDTLFSIDILHNYYTDKLCTDIRLEPTEACRRTMQNLRLFFRATGSGGLVGRELKEGEAGLEPAIRPDREELFVFKMLLNNPFFWNITDVDMTGVGPAKVFVFGHGEGLSTGSDGSLRLHAGRLSGAVRLYNRVVRYSFEGVEAKTLFVYDWKDRVVYGTILTEGQQSHRIEMSSSPEGLYRIRLYDRTGAVVREESFFLTQDSHTDSPFGFILIRQSMLTDGSPPYKFKIEFSPREISWTYRISIGSSGGLHSIDANRLRIVDAPVRFSKSVSGTGAERIVEFNSESPIELKEKPYSSIQLVEEPSTEEERRVLIKPLPNPDVRRLEKDGNRGFRSIIYLTIK